MRDVTDQNFNSEYLILWKDVKEASFIAIDAKFSGIHSDKIGIQSVFDTHEYRYNNLKKNIQPFVIIQFGITTFHHIPGNYDNTYKTKCFNFYLFPRNAPSINRHISFEVTSLEFLYKHKFMFNNLIADGISYLNKIEEEQLKKFLNEDEIDICRYLSQDEAVYLKECREKFFEWFEHSDHESLIIENLTPSLQYILKEELEKKYDDVLCLSNCKEIKFVRNSKKLKALPKKPNLKNELLNTYTTFSKVIKLLVFFKKPIVGHNLLLNLMFIHQQFYKPLPDSYYEFKRNIHSLFPQIYDTKFINYELQKMKKSTGETCSLNTLYVYFSTFNSPDIELNNKSTSFGNAHHAGWNSYCAGCIFAKMEYLFTFKYSRKPITGYELMSSVKDFVNCVNITKNNEQYMKFGGEDPKQSKPEWLYVELKSPFNNKKEMKHFSNFGPMDIFRFSERNALLAVANQKSCKSLGAIDGPRIIAHAARYFQATNSFSAKRI